MASRFEKCTADNRHKRHKYLKLRLYSYNLEIRLAVLESIKIYSRHAIHYSKLSCSCRVDNNNIIVSCLNLHVYELLMDF